MNSSFSRRQFLRTGVAAAVAAGTIPTFITGCATGRTKKSANDRVNLGFIGVGPQGRHVLGNFLPLQEARVVAVCDVYNEALHKTSNRINEFYKNDACTAYTDFRKLLERKDIDAVVIASPDHWHVPMGIAAVQAGKDIYVEKPMGVTIAESQLMRKWVHRTKRVFQFGTQQRSNENFRKACELVRNGRIGKLQKIYAWCPASRPGGSTAPAPIPPGLDYDYWLGPAPYSPNTDKKTLGFGPEKTWWYNTDYAVGFIGGWGIHPLDIAHWAHPEMMQGDIMVEGKTLIPAEGACNTSVAWDITYSLADSVTMQFKGTPNEYTEKNALNDFSEWAAKFPNMQEHGNAFEGTNGWILIDRTQIRSSSPDLLQDGENKIRLLRSSNHYLNFIQAVKSRNSTVCPIDEAVQSDYLPQIGDIASRLGRKLRFDPVSGKFPGDAEATSRAALRPMRKHWSL